MSFSLPRFLRGAPRASLAQYFAIRSVPLPETLNWDAGPRALAIILSEAIETLGRADHDQVIRDFERVDQLCNPIGQQALQSLVASSGKAEFLALLRAADSNESRAIMVLLDDQTLFEHAHAVCYANRLRNGRSWSGFNVPHPSATIAGVELHTALETDIAELLTQYDGTGRKLKIERFEHRTHDRDAKPTGLNIHHSIYSEGLPESLLEFEGREPRPHTRRPVHEGAISYDPDRRVLDVVSRGGKPIREKMARSYARRILGVTSDLRPVLSRTFFLDRLKHPIRFPSDPADGLKSVNVTLLRLQDMSGGAGWVTLETDDSDRTDIHKLSGRWFGDADPLRLANWRVTHAKLRIVFHTEAGQTRDKTVTIELRAPNGSNLREQLRHHQIISEKYLARWGLVELPGA